MSEAKANNAQSAAGTGTLIFVVDDEPMLLELAVVILEPQGFVVKSFRDPEMAFEAFTAASPRPGLVITDYAMHSMNGMELTRKVRSLNPRQRILLLSGTVGEDVFQDEPHKPDLFLAKPYQAHQLTNAVKSLIEKK